MKIAAIIRLLKETKYRPVKINHNSELNVFTLLEYELIPGSTIWTNKIFHERGTRKECLDKIKLLQQEDKNIFHVNY